MRRRGHDSASSPVCRSLGASSGFRCWAGAKIDSAAFFLTKKRAAFLLVDCLSRNPNSKLIAFAWYAKPRARATE